MAAPAKAQKPTAAQVYVATESFTIRLQGRRRFYHRGRTIVAGTDPILRLRPTAFRLQVVPGLEAAPAMPAAPSEPSPVETEA